MDAYEILGQKIKTVTHRLSEIVQLGEVCRNLLYNSEISASIPESRGGYTFIALQSSVFHHMLVRLVALWDPKNETYGLQKIQRDVSADIEGRPYENVRTNMIKKNTTNGHRKTAK